MTRKRTSSGFMMAALAMLLGMLGSGMAQAAPASMQVVVSPSQSTFWRAGEVITYSYVLYHTGGVATVDITAPFTVTDSMLPGGTTITCPATPTKLVPVDTTGVPGITCKADYTVTAADVTRGYIENGTIAAAAASAEGVVNATLSPTSTLRVEHSPIRIFNLTAPNLVIDSNKAASGQGPKSFMAGATVCNVADNTVSDVRMNIGDGSTAGVFPTTSCPAGGGIPQLTCNGSKPYVGDFVLKMIDGYTQGAARLIGDLESNLSMAPAKCKTVYWPLKYDLVDASGKPLFGATTPVADDIRWNYKIWASANVTEGGVPVPHKAQLDAYVVGRSEITANPNKIDPTGATQTITPNPTGPGYLITTTFNNVDFSGADQGFDVVENNGAGDGQPDADIWFQPIGNGTWDTNLFRLVEVNATLRGSGSNCGTNGVTFSRRNQWYYPHMNAVDANGVPGGTFTCSGWRGDYSYTFMALKAGQAAISPYQEVASGANNEKYNGDYCGDNTAGDPAVCGVMVSSDTGTAKLAKTVDKATALPGDTLTYTLAYGNTSTSALGSPDFGAPVVLRDAIPANSTFVAGSAKCPKPASATASPFCDIYYSTDGGTTFTPIEPTPASSVTNLYWALKQAIPANAGASWGTVEFKVTGSAAFTSGTITNNSNMGIYGGPNIAESSVDTTVVPTPTIAISKTASDDTDSQSLLSGGTANFKITITNTSSVTLTNLMLTDALTPGCAGAPTPSTLAAGATATKTCSLANVTAAFTNSATVTAQPVDASSNPLGGTITATDTTAVVLVNPAIDIIKTAADDTDTQAVTSGGTASFKIKVTNTGNVPLTGVVVTDPLSTDCSKTIGSLAVGASDEYTCTQASVSSGFTNVASVSGTPPSGAAVTDSDSSIVTILTPGLSIEKTPDNQTVKKGSDVTFTIKVTNTGSTTLSPVEVTDANTPDCNKSIASIAPTTSVTYSCTHTAALTSFVNTAVATSGALTTSDVANVTVIDPAIEVTKLTNDFDGKEIRVGTLVTWEYIVRNTGDAALTDIKLSDNKIGPISCPGTSLAAGAYMTCLSYGPATSGDYTNTATVTADSPLGNDDVTDTDGSSYKGVNPGAIGNTVWLDENGNGTREAGEAGIPNLTVTLLGAGPNGTFGDGDDTTTNTVTDANGGYLFTNLPAGEYRVTVTPTAGLNATYNEDTLTVSPDSVTEVTLTAGEYHLTADFGYNWVPAGDSSNPSVLGTTGAIGDRVWNDIDGDRRQDDGEAGIGGVTVTLQGPGADGLFGTADDTTVATTTTDAAGNYIFDGLAPGAYAVVVDPATLPAGQTWTQTADPDGSGADNRTTDPVVLAPGDVYVNADFGYRPSTGNVIGDTIFFDADADTGQDVNEPGIAGVTVALLDGSGNVIATMATDASGKYAFRGLPAGTYTVLVTDTNGVLRELQLLADPEHRDDPIANPTPDNETTVTFPGVSGTDLSRDFAYTSLGQHDYTAEIPELVGAAGTIGDTVFLDRNGDGLFDAGEGLEGVTVNLYLADGSTLVATTQTNANGLYSFGHVNVFADWVVKVDTSTLPNGGTGLSNSVDPDGGSDSTSAVSNISATGNINLNQDFGYTATSPATIGGRLYHDTNADGLIITAPDGLEFVTVELRDALGRVVAVTTTDVKGDYSFTNLPPGTYTVHVTDTRGVLEGWWHSLGPNSTNPAIDNDSKVEGIAVPVTAGETNTNIDFGYYYRGAAIGNRAWLDANNNGIQDSAEVIGVEGVEMTLVIKYATGDTTTLKAVSNATGQYRFGNLLLDETYRTSTNAVETPTSTEPSFKIVAGAGPTGYVQGGVYAAGTFKVDSDVHAGVFTYPIVKGRENMAINAANPTLEEDNASYDFAYRASLIISGKVFNDADGDGDLSDRLTELGLASVTVTLYTDPNGDGDPSDGVSVETTTTNANGEYTFSGIPAGSYVVVETNPANHESTNDVESPNDDRIPVTLTTSNVTDRDFLDTFRATPIPNTGIIGDSVWLDSNGDGVRQGNEAGLSGVPVYLCATTPCTSANKLLETVTDTNGNYLFIGLVAGTYYVGVDKPYADLDPTTFASGTSVAIDLTIGQTFMDADFGYQPTTGEAAIGDRVWLDTNGDGLQDPGETGIGGVVVKVYEVGSGPINPANTVATATTKPDGTWLVTGLTVGKNYIVVVDPTTLPASVIPTATNLGSGNDTHITGVLGDGVTLTHLDFGYAPPAGTGSIGDKIWFDALGTGSQTGSEPGIAGVTVNLIKDGNVLATTTTDASGNYSFSGLTDGIYSVAVTDLANKLEGLVLSTRYQELARSPVPARLR